MISFFVPGKPQSQGSKVRTKFGVRETNKELGPWRERIALAAHAALDGQGPLRGPVAVTLYFRLYRPLSAPKKRTPPATKAPDIDKLARACLDAMTHVLYQDDAQVTTLLASKRVAEIGEELGVQIKVLEDKTGP